MRLCGWFARSSYPCKLKKIACALSLAGGGAFFGCDLMKKIKLFFIRNYQRFIRFLISLSVVSAFIIGQAFTSSAVTYIDCVYSQPQLTGKNCYLEIVTSNNWHWLVVVQLDAFSDAVDISDVGFTAFISENYFCVSTTTSIPSSMLLSGFRVDMDSGIMTSFEHVEAGNRNDSMRTWIGSAGTITGIHGYNCNVTSITTATKNNFAVNYGTDISLRSSLNSVSVYVSQLMSYTSSIKTVVNTINTNLVNIFNQNKAFFGSTNMDQILKAIQDNKSSAEKNVYSGATDEQKQAQSNLDAADKKISDDTADARASTINIFKNFSLPGDIMKGLLCVTNIFNSLCSGVPFAPIILNFSLAIGAAAFLLGLTAVFVRFGRSRK